MYETDLFNPVKTLLESMGYHIKGEIGALDVFGISDKGSIAIELKLSITLKLIYQAIDRQKVADIVYVAVPKDALKKHQKQYKSLIDLLKRLNLGLIVVEKKEASILLETQSFETSKLIHQKRKTKRILSEFHRRENHVNVGGTKGKKVTAYKESVIRVAHMLSKMKTASPKQLKAHTGIDHADTILMKNYEGWFEKVDRGIYQLSSKGEQELSAYLSLLDLG